MPRFWISPHTRLFTISPIITSRRFPLALELTSPSLYRFRNCCVPASTSLSMLNNLASMSQNGRSRCDCISCRYCRTSCALAYVKPRRCLTAFIVKAFKSVYPRFGAFCSRAPGFIFYRIGPRLRKTFQFAV